MANSKTTWQSSKLCSNVWKPLDQCISNPGRKPVNSCKRSTSNCVRERYAGKRSLNTWSSDLVKPSNIGTREYLSQSSKHATHAVVFRELTALMTKVEMPKTTVPSRQYHRSPSLRFGRCNEDTARDVDFRNKGDSSRIVGRGVSTNVRLVASWPAVCLLTVVVIGYAEAWSKDMNDSIRWICTAQTAHCPFFAMRHSRSSATSYRTQQQPICQHQHTHDTCTSRHC